MTGNTEDMPLWKKPIDVEALNASSKGTAVEALGIVVTEIRDDAIIATMPVDHRTKQPFGILHGGASALLAETLGSMASDLASKPGFHPVGVELNASHLRSAHKGYVTGIAKPIRAGLSMQVWQIDLEDQRGKLLCSSRLSCMIRKGSE